MTNFSDFSLSDALVESLGRMQITVPTPIQQATIPIALEGRDVLASAQTGTGKTIAYSIPLIMKLASSPQSSALILTPTRELAMQVQQALHLLIGKGSNFKTALLIGGAPMFKQISDLRRKPQLIVGTPGRITDHLERGSLSLKDTNFLVIDEADRMLDMGFGIQLDTIAEYLPTDRQTLMFSATLPPNIDKLSKKYLRDPQRVTIDTTNQPAAKIKQEILHTKSHEKFDELLKQLDEREGSIIIFVKTKRSADRLSSDLKEQGHSTDAIHGDLPQRRRERVIQTFRSKKSRILVATDVAARGLDIPHVMHVINFDLPQCPEDYIHRIGRTGRAGAEGNAICFISPDETGKWKAIHRLMNPQSKEQFPSDSGFQGRSSSRNRPDSRRDGRSFRGSNRFQSRPDRFGSDRSHSERSFGSDRPFKSERSFNSERSFKSESSSFSDSNSRDFDDTRGGFGKPRTRSGIGSYQGRSSFGDKPSFSSRSEQGSRPRFGDDQGSQGRSPQGRGKPSSHSSSRGSFSKGPAGKSPFSKGPFSKGAFSR